VKIPPRSKWRKIWHSRKWSMLTIAWAIVVIPIMAYLAFSNPDMTRTRLFLTYWPLFTVCIIIGLALSALRGWFE